MDPVSWHPPEINPDLPLGAYKTDDGDLAVWVNASPDSQRHGGGWFEPYKGKPKDYRPQRAAESDEKGYLDFDAAEAAHEVEQERALKQQLHDGLRPEVALATRVGLAEA